MTMHIVIASLAFPWWVGLTHYINLLFIGLVIRSGIQIAGAHPRLYWNDGYLEKRSLLTPLETEPPDLDQYLAEHRELGLSLYDVHSDGRAVLPVHVGG